MAAHAGTAIVNDRIVGIISVRHYCDWSIIQPATCRVDQHISLKPVWEVKDDLPARRLQPKRILKYILLVQAGLEVKAFPVGSVRRNVPLENTVVLRDAAAAQAC